MSISMYQASVPVFIRTLENLSAILDKAVTHANARKIDLHAFLGARLFPDMFAFTRQVQLACDFAKNGTTRLAGIEPPKFADTEASFDELQERIARTIELLKGIRPEQIDNSETREISFPVGGKPMTFQGQPYLLHWVLPNFFFHIATAYNLLRHNGVEIGKLDFLGRP